MDSRALGNATSVGAPSWRSPAVRVLGLIIISIVVGVCIVRSGAWALVGLLPLAALGAILLPVEALLGALLVAIIVPVRLASVGGIGVDWSIPIECALAGRALMRPPTALAVPGVLGALALAGFAFLSVYLSWAGTSIRVGAALSRGLPLVLYVVVLRLLPDAYSTKRWMRWTQVLIAAYSAYLLVGPSVSQSLPGFARQGSQIQQGSLHLSRLASAAMPPNTLGVFLLLPLIGLRVELIARRRPTWFMLGSSALVAVAFIRTYSRNGLICLLAAEIILLVLSAKRRSRVIWTGALAGFAAIGFLVVASGGESDTLVKAYTRGNGFLNVAGPVDASGSQAVELSFSERQFLWSSGVRVFADHPLLGTGFGPNWANIPTREHAGETFIRGAHNSYITILAIGGIVGFGCLVSFLVPTTTAALRRARRESAHLMSSSESRAAVAGATWMAASVVAFAIDDIFFLNGAFTVIWMLTALAVVRPRALIRPRDTQPSLVNA